MQPENTADIISGLLMNKYMFGMLSTIILPSLVQFDFDLVELDVIIFGKVSVTSKYMMCKNLGFEREFMV